MTKLLLRGLIIVFVSAFLLVSCHRQIIPAEIVVFPSPPDTARIQYLTSISSSADIIKRSAFAKFVLGEQKVLPISKPYGVAIHKGKIYVCDMGKNGLDVIGLDKKSFSYFIPKGKGELKAPLNCFFDELDNLYVADGERRQIVIFDKNGQYVNAFGEKEKFKPTDVVVHGNRVWVANLADNRVYVYDKDSVGKLLYKFPDSSPGNDEYLYSPVNLFVGNNRVYVSDIGGSNVKIFDLEGNFIQAIGSNGNQPGQFTRNKGITADRDGNIFVVDASFENVQAFNKEGKLLMAFGGPYTGHGYMWLPAKVCIDYDNIGYFQKYVDPSFKLKYLLIVTNQYGPDKLSIYGAVEHNPLYKKESGNDNGDKKKDKKKSSF